MHYVLADQLPGAPTPPVPTPNVGAPGAATPPAAPATQPMPGNNGPDLSMMQGSIDQISNAGRNILKSIEEYKFKIDQVGRILKNNPQVTALLEAKKKNLDSAANEIYQLVFSIENIDIVNIQNQLPPQPSFDAPGKPAPAKGMDNEPKDGEDEKDDKSESSDSKKDENSGMPDAVKR